MEMRHILSIVTAGLLLIGLAGCGEGQPTGPEDVPGKISLEEATAYAGMAVPDMPASPDSAVFAQFLHGDLEASLNHPSHYSLSYVSYGEGGRYTLEALRDAVNKNSEIGGNPGENLSFPYEKIYYGIWDTLLGGKVLAIKFQNMDIYDAMDSSYALFVFAVDESGTLDLTYAYDSWCRSEVTILDGGTFSGIGDGGTAKADWFGFLDAEGQYQEVFRRITEYNAGFSVTGLRTAGGEFYAYETDGTNQEGVDLWIRELENRSVSYIDNMDGAIETAYAGAGIDRDALQPYDDWTLWAGK